MLRQKRAFRRENCQQVNALDRTASNSYSPAPFLVQIAFSRSPFCGSSKRNNA